MDILIERHLENVEIPANLRINDQIKIYRKRCEEMGCLRPYHHFDEYVSMAKVYPEKTIVTGGLSKDRSAGGYRVGVGIFPDDKSFIEGIHASIPKGAFYLFVDFNDYKNKLQEIGFVSCADFCEHLVKVEHTALLPGNSLLLPPDHFSVRLSYVDYDGDEVLKAWQTHRPQTQIENEVFFETHCPLVADGIRNIERYFSQVKKRKKPIHIGFD